MAPASSCRTGLHEIGRNGIEDAGGEMPGLPDDRVSFFKKISLVLFSFIIIFRLNAQEICNNGIDDDNDGLIDLQDPQCKASVYPLIANPSFEKISNCPTYFAQLEYAVPWRQTIGGGGGSTELFHKCGNCYYQFDQFVPYMPTPPPDGSGFAGFGDVKSLQNQGSYKEYVGTCALMQLEQDSAYVIEFYIGFMDPIFGTAPGTAVVSYSPVNISVFGNPSCNSIPYGNIVDSTSKKCPLKAGAAWVELAQVSVTGTTGQWTKVRAEFVSPVNINALVIGPSCQATPFGSDGDWAYYYLDEVWLYKKDIYNIPFITRTGDLCSGGVTLVANMNPQPSMITYQWYKDGVALVGETDPSLFITQTQHGVGYYSVMVVAGGKSYLSAEATVVLENMNFVLPDVVGLCGGQPATLKALFPGNVECFLTYRWQDGTTSPELTVTAPGEYWLEVKNGGCTKRDTVVVVEYAVPTVDLGNDTTLCSGSSLVLSAGNPGVEYEWQDGSTFPDFTVTASGTYYVTVYNEYCSVSDTIKVKFDVSPYVIFNSDSILCEGQQKILKPNVHGDAFLWNTGSTDPSITISQPGTYSLQVQNGCGSASASIHIIQEDCQFFMPDAFTPNQDGKNDLFGLPKFGFVRDFDCRIFNRWGQIVFSSTDPARKWDGKFDGKDSPEGVYVWMVRYTDFNGNSYTKRGTVALLR